MTPRLTKLDMARVVVMALFNLPGLPPVDHRGVMQYAKQKRETLTRQHKMAIAALRSVGRQP